MSGASTPSPIRGCRFPGCDRLAAAGDDGVGRPPEYCDDPAHSRGSAWRARRAARATIAGRPAPEDLERPVTMAHARAGHYIDTVTAQVVQLTDALNVVLAELRTLGDPEATAVQIDAVTADADQRVAAANAHAAHAEADRRTAEHRQAEADAAAEDATAHAEAMTVELAAARRAHQEQLDQFSTELAAAHDATRTQQHRAEDAESAVAEAGLRAVTLTAELAAARQRLEDERTHTQTRLADQRASYEDRVTELRAELDQLKTRRPTTA